VAEDGINLQDKYYNPEDAINPLLVQFKSLLPGQEGCVFFSPQQ
jgi:hypothetical protein